MQERGRSFRLILPVVSTVVAAAATVAALVLTLPLTGCLMHGECAVEGVPATNLTAEAGDRSVTLAWDIPEHDVEGVDKVWAVVKYDVLGGDGAPCNTYDPNSETPGCTVACPLSEATSCTVNGLVNGRSYTFTVITQAIATNPGCTSGTAFIRSESVTPDSAGAPIVMIAPES